MIRRLNFNNFEEVVKHIEDLSKDYREKVTYNLKEMFRKFPKHFTQLESNFRKYNEKGDK